jgi:transmembrane sensor
MGSFCIRITYSMDNKYLKYTLDELLDDQDFIGYVIHGNNKPSWENLFKSSPEFRIKALKARKIIELLRDSADDLSETEILELWKNIDRFDNLVSQKKKSKSIYRVMRYAALVLLLISLGSITWWYLTPARMDAAYRFSGEVSDASAGDTRLILHGGEEISLLEDNSSIRIKEDGKIQINDDRVVSGKDQKGQAGMNEVVVPYGKKSQLTLSDGTKVWLNAGSRMAFPSEFQGKHREVFIEGEAYFEVKSLPSKPFYVHLKDVAVKVLGTRFNISAYPSDNSIETVLLEGKISLTDKEGGAFAKRETILEPNQKASFEKVNRHFSVDPVEDAGTYIAWTSGWFSFSQEMLSDVLRKLERYYNVKFEYENEILSAGLISGKLDLKESLDQVMMVLSDVAGIEYRIQKNIITVTKSVRKLPVKK